jgi:hypothetical protein
MVLAVCISAAEATCSKAWSRETDGGLARTVAALCSRKVVAPDSGGSAWPNGRGSKWLDSDGGTALSGQGTSGGGALLAARKKMGDGKENRMDKTISDGWAASV